MILITGTVVVAPEKRTAFLEVARQQVTNSRTEEGCISYHCGEDAFAAGTFTFLERWRDAEAVQIHFAKDYSIAFVSEARRLAANSPVIEIHDVANVRNVTPRA
jgi:quinol monooxygenase YgiN